MNKEEDIMNEKVASVDDYISRRSVIDAIRYRVCQGQGNKEYICKRGSCAYCGIMEIMCDISSISSADVQPVKFARWIDLDNRILCSGCGAGYDDSNEVKRNTYIFCPNCGARMLKDGDTNG